MINRALLTGIPRSGTTLCCAVLNDVPDVLALVEPWPVTHLRGTTEDLLALVEAAFDHSSSLALDGWALSKGVAGGVADNIVESKTSGVRRRKPIARRARIAIEPLTAHGTLIVKHNAFFTALLPALARSFPVYAVVRNPVSVMASWRSVDLPVARGRVPAGEHIDRKLARSLGRCSDEYERQLLILNWFFERYAESISTNRIVRYEELVEGASAPLRYLGATRWEPKQNENRAYPGALREIVAKELLRRGGAFEAFYTRDDILSAAH